MRRPPWRRFEIIVGDGTIQVSRESPSGLVVYSRVFDLSPYPDLPADVIMAIAEKLHEELVPVYVLERCIRHRKIMRQHGRDKLGGVLSQKRVNMA